jgi:hypothetical protein
MRYLERIWRATQVALVVVAGWLAVCDAALAQMQGARPVKPAESVNSGAWVFAYFLAILGIVAGLLFVCRSGGRRERARPEQYGEGKVSVVEEEKK